jgi:S-adenosylmethionine hydrolase
MPTITLTSDMGTADHYLAAVKGAILRQLDPVNLVDISHAITPFDTSEAAFILRHCWKSFAKGTVHIIGVNAETTLERPHRVVEADGQFFVGTDNGIFALIFDQKPDAIWNLDLPMDSDVLTFPMRDVLVKAACHLARGGAASFIGKPAPSLHPADDIRPVLEDGVVKGYVTHVDRYENLITNISRSLFDEVRKGRDFSIIMKRSKHDIRSIATHYGAVPDGERVALFNEAGLLEIAINRGAPGNGGGASSLFGLRKGDLVRVEFASHD